jgi:cytochrome P450
VSGEVQGRLAPGPRGHPLLGNSRGFQQDLIGTLLNGWRNHGDVVRFRGVGPLFPVYLVAHPDYVKHVLQDNHKNYPKTPFVNDKWRMVVGEGLICSEGDFWRRQRRLAQPAFHRKLIDGFGKLMVDNTARMLARWDGHAQRGEEVNATVEMTHLALAVLAQALFSADWTREAEVMGPAVEVAIGHAYHQMEEFVTLPEFLPTPANRRFKKARAALDEIVYRLIAERHKVKEEEQPPDLLAALMNARDEETGGGRMSDEQVRNEVMTFMFGGHETVAAGLSWTLYLLSKHPEAARRLTAEVEEVLAGRAPTLEDLPRLTYTTMLINESLRLYPPVWLISRTPVADDVVGGYRIPAGSMVLLSSFVSHRHPAFWEDPEGFDPERFSPERSQDRPRHAWFPFSGGPRKCIGDYFGIMEMQIVISMIVQRFRADLAPGHPVIPKPGITLGQKEGMFMTLHAPATRDQAPGSPTRTAPSSTRTG